MNRAERLVEERAVRRAEAIVHKQLLPDGCPECLGTQPFLGWLGLVSAYDVWGFEQVKMLMDALGDVPDDQQIDIWACGCGARGAVVWGGLKQP